MCVYVPRYEYKCRRSPLGSLKWDRGFPSSFRAQKRFHIVKGHLIYRHSRHRTTVPIVWHIQYGGKRPQFKRNAVHLKFSPHVVNMFSTLNFKLRSLLKLALMRSCNNRGITGTCSSSCLKCKRLLSPLLGPSKTRTKCVFCALSNLFS